MFDEQSLKEKLLDELMEELGNADGDKIKPKGLMAVSVEKGDSPESDDHDLGMKMAEGMGHDEPDSDDLKPEDLEKILSMLQR